jgi:pectate lyase
MQEEPVAFPGAEGFGKFTKGGRGGFVYKVTNLNDDGEGSLRYCLNKKGPRIIVFDVSGTIHLKSPLNIKEYTTLAGQTAPGDGICIADQPVKINGDQVIVRYLRFRMGDRYQNDGMKDGSGHDDALGAVNKKHIIIDHCSLSWSTDEVLSVYNGDSTTLQWNIITEPLNYSYHFEKGDKNFENHGYGGIWGGRHLTAHHNLLAHCLSRNPRFNGTRSINEEFVDYRNNVIYNWGINNVYGGEGGHYNIVNNYYRYGPSTHEKVRFRVVNPSKSDQIPFGKYFVDGNYVDGSPDVTKNNLLGVHMGNGTEEDKRSALVSHAFSSVEINRFSAKQAYEDVLLNAGASFKRDTLDSRVIEDVKQRTGRIIDVQGGFPHGTPYEQTVSAWPVLQSTTPAIDSDGDGMPDDWEKTQGLNATDARDASILSLHSRYTNIEVYINGLIKDQSN